MFVNKKLLYDYIDSHYVKHLDYEYILHDYFIHDNYIMIYKSNGKDGVIDSHSISIDIYKGWLRSIKLDKVLDGN